MSSGLSRFAPERPPATAPNCLFDELEGGVKLAANGLTAEGQRTDVYLRSNGSTSCDVFASKDEADVILKEFGKVDTRSLVVDTGAMCQIERNGGGVAADDFDGDGWPDVVLSGTDAPILLRNRGDGTFEDATEPSGIGAAWRAAGTASGRSNGVAFFDCDNDADADLYVTTLAGKQHYLFVNTDGRGAFEEQAALRGVAVLGDAGSAPAVRTAGTGIAVGDYDGDGWLDLYVAEWRPYTVGAGGSSGSRLMRNLGGAGRACFFEDATEAAGLALEALTPPLLLRGMRAYPYPEPGRPDESEHASHNLQQSDGALVDTITNGIFTFSPAFVDLDGDGWLDLAIAGDFHTSMLFFNQRDGRFSEEVSAASGVGKEENGMGSAFADVDCDGHLDWFVSSVYDTRPRDYSTPFGVSGNRLYRWGSATPASTSSTSADRSSSGQFDDWTDDAGVRRAYWGWGAVFGDFDLDGDPDLFVANGYTLPETMHEDPFNLTPNKLFLNPANGCTKLGAPVSRWIDEASYVEGGSFDSMREGRAVVTLDFDRDGSLDLLIANYGAAPTLLRGLASDHSHDRGTRWLSVRVCEPPPQGSTKWCGRPSHGAVISVQSISNSSIMTGNSNTEGADGVDDTAPRQTNVVGVNGHFLGHSEYVVHFGLGHSSSPKADGAGEQWTLAVRWAAPHADTAVSFRVTTPNRLIEIRRPTDKRNLRGRAAEYIRDAQKPPPADHVDSMPTVAKSEEVDISPQVTDDRAHGEAVTLTPATPLPAACAQRADTVAEAALDRSIELLVRARKQIIFRSINGRGNNEAHPLWGAAVQPHRRLSPADYRAAPDTDSGNATLDQPAGTRRPSARHVSNVLCDEHARPPSSFDQQSKDGGEHVNTLFMFLGQLLGHDISLTTPVPGGDAAESMPIRIPLGDPQYDPHSNSSSSHTLMRMRRSIYKLVELDGDQRGARYRREQMNKVTSYLDASFVYGNDAKRAMALRTGCGGELASQTHPSSRRAMPPFNIPTRAVDNEETEEVGKVGVVRGHRGQTAMENANPLAAPTEAMFVLGDTRAMENPGLLGLQVIFLREHNYLAAKIRAALQRETGLEDRSPPEVCNTSHDEEVYQLTRVLLIAMWQSLVYHEFLPILLGGANQAAAAVWRDGSYTGYDASIDASVFNEFATAAHRFGHSISPSSYMVNPERGSSGADDKDASVEEMPLRDAYFIHGTQYLADGPSIEALLLGAAQHRAELVDERVTEALRNFLFGPGQMNTRSPHVGSGGGAYGRGGRGGGGGGGKGGAGAAAAGRGFGLDLAALNVQRGRDHGLSSYSSVRAAIGLRQKTLEDGEWESSGCAPQLRMLYGTADNVDLWIGGLCERPAPSAVTRGYGGLLGETFAVITSVQFATLRAGDRFWHERPRPHGLGGELAAAVHEATSLRSLLRRHGVNINAEPPTQTETEAAHGDDEWRRVRQSALWWRQ